METTDRWHLQMMGGLYVRKGTGDLKIFSDSPEGRLLAYLAYHVIVPIDPVPPRKSIANSLYQDHLDSRDSLDGCVCTLNKSLHGLIRTGKGVLHIHTHVVDTDVQVFEKKASNAKEQQEKKETGALQLYAEAVSSYRPLLQGFDLNLPGMERLKTKRQLLEQAYRRICVEYAETLLISEDAAAAREQAETVYKATLSSPTEQDRLLTKAGKVIVDVHVYQGNIGALEEFRAELEQLGAKNELEGAPITEKQTWRHDLIARINEKIGEMDAASRRALGNLKVVEPAVAWPSIYNPPQPPVTDTEIHAASLEAVSNFKAVPPTIEQTSLHNLPEPQHSRDHNQNGRTNDNLQAILHKLKSKTIIVVRIIAVLVIVLLAVVLPWYSSMRQLNLRRIETDSASGWQDVQQPLPTWAAPSDFTQWKCFRFRGLAPALPRDTKLHFKVNCVHENIYILAVELKAPAPDGCLDIHSNYAASHEWECDRNTAAAGKSTEQVELYVWLGTLPAWRSPQLSDITFTPIAD